MTTTAENPFNLEKSKVIILEPEDRIYRRKKTGILRFLWVAAGAGIAMALIASQLQFHPAREISPVLISGFQVQQGYGIPEIFSTEKKCWLPLPFQGPAPSGGKIRTDVHSQVDLKFGEGAVLRLKPGSEIEARQAAHSYGPKVHLRLNRGNLLGLIETPETSQLQFLFSNPDLQMLTHQARFLLNFNVTTQTGWLGLLEGEASVDQSQKNPLKLAARQKIKLDPSSEEKNPAPITEEDWTCMKESYDLSLFNTSQKEQLGFIKQLRSSFFPYVQDIEIYRLASVPGFMSTQIEIDPETRKPYLSMNYDVFPDHSVAGVSFKTQGLNLSQFESLKMEVRKNPKHNSPEMITLQIKSANSVIRKYDLKNFRNPWSPIAIPILVAENTPPVKEINILFAHSRVGAETHGSLEFRNLELIPHSSNASLVLPSHIEDRDDKLHTNAKKKPSPIHEPADELDSLVSKLQSLNQILKQTALQDSITSETKASPS